MLVHGVVVSSRYLTPVAAELARDFEVHVPDLPGFGLSDNAPRPLGVRALATALLEWLDAAGIANKPALLGNSVGSQIALDAALQRPNRTGPLILTGPTIDAEARNARTQIARWLTNGLHEHPSQALFLPRDFTDAGIRRTVALFRSALADEPERKIAATTQPILIVRGHNDPVAPQRWADELARTAQNAHTQTIPGPHNVNYTSPKALAHATREFLAAA